MSACIRIASERDAKGIAAIYEPIVRETAISFELEPPTVEEMCGRVTSTLERFPWLVCEHEGRVAGYAYAGAHRARAAYQWAADVSIYNHEEYRGAGLGRALYGALFEVLRSQGYRMACAGITLPNAASVGLHEALGFEPVGVYRDIGYKLGGWHSVGWWQLRLGQDEGAPGMPTPFPAVRDAAAVTAALSKAPELLKL